MRMQGRKQLERTTTIGAPVGVVYELFVDNQALPDWAPVVDAVVREEGGDGSGIGCTRTCEVTINGRSGTMVERCVEAVRNSRASYVVVDDSFGFNKTLRDYSFTVHFLTSGEAQTAVRIETFYTPANPVAAVLNPIMMRRKFGGVIDALLDGLRAAAEQRHRASA